MQGRRAAGGLMDSATAVAYTGPRFAVTGAASIRAAQPFDPVPEIRSSEPTGSLVVGEGQTHRLLSESEIDFEYPEDLQ